MLIGYARVSKGDQLHDLQVDALQAAGCERIYIDTLGGARADKAKLQEALSYLRTGDTLVVWRLDRLGRDLRGLLELLAELDARGVEFHSLQDAMDTSTPAGRLLFHICGAFAELERNLIRERTEAGLKAARARGRKGGRPKAIDDATLQMARTLMEAPDANVRAICRRLGIKTRTLYRYLQQPAQVTAK